MARALLILANPAIRAKAADWLVKAPDGTRVEFKAPQRTLEQNSRMWAMLTDIATQQEHGGRKYPADDWKAIFLSALGRETRFVPSLYGESFIPIGQSSSDLSKQEMSDLIELMFAWGTENGVVFNEPEIKTERVGRAA
jgi:hypothetical protein